MKKKIELIASVETFNKLSTFESVDQLNKAVRHYKDSITLTKTEFAVLDLLHRHSCRYFGVSFLRKSVIAKMVGKSRRTIIRVVAKLAELGIVKQYEMKRAKDMQQTSNAIVIQTPPVTQEPAQNVTHKTTTGSLKQNTKTKERKRVCDSPINYDYTFVSSSVPEAFVKGVAPFFRSAKDIYRMWNRLNLAAKQSGVEGHLVEFVDECVKTFKEAIYAYKTRGLKCDIYGYMYGAWRNVTSVLARRVYAYRAPYLYDWLAD